MRLKRILVVASNGATDAAALRQVFAADHHDVRVLRDRSQLAAVAAEFVPDLIVCQGSANGDEPLQPPPEVPVVCWNPPLSPDAPTSAPAWWEESGDDLGHFDFNVDQARVRLSSSARRILGLADEAAATVASLRDRLSTADRAAVEAAWDDLLAGRRNSVNLSLALTNDPGQPATPLQVAASWAGHERTLSGMIRDLSTTQQLNEALADKNRYLERAQALAHIGLYKLDLTEGSWSSSPELDALLGIDDAYPHDVTGWLQLIEPSHREEMQRYLSEEVVGRRTQFDRIYPIVRPCDGTLRWLHGVGELQFSADDQPLAMIGTIQDITEEKKAAESLRLQVSALNAAANAIVITDRDGRIEWANRAFSQHTGFEPAEALGKNPRELIRSGQHDQAFYRQMWDTILAGQVWQGELINRHKDGHTFTEEMTITPILDARGEVTRFIAVKQDISHRRKLELQLRQSQKLDAIGRLAGGVAHDFNNILAAVLLNLEMLELENDLGDDALESIREITREIKRGTALTRQLLAFGRKEAMQRTVVDLPDLVHGLFKMLGRLLGEQVRVRFDLAPDLPPLHADPGMIEQVVLNLCINARDAMPDGGELTLRARPVEINARTAALHAAAPGRYVCLSVSDTGHGMTQEVLQHIFEPFYTTKAEGRGTGLGLSTVYGIAQQHQGWLTVDSTVGEGSTFHLHLPLPSSRPRPAPAARKAEAAHLQGHGETVLIVEDDPSLLRSLAALLRRSNYRVLTATDGLQALDTWKANPGRITLLLTDLTLPNGLSGRDLIARLQQEQPGLRTVACSGYRQNELPSDSTLRVLPKPFDYQLLLSTVRELLDTA